MTTILSILMIIISDIGGVKQGIVIKQTNDLFEETVQAFVLFQEWNLCSNGFLHFFNKLYTIPISPNSLAWKLLLTQKLKCSAVSI